MKQIGMTLVAAGMAIGLCGVSVAQDDTKSADKSFVKDAIEGSQAEINYAKLALQKSHDASVRQFAQMMIKDHSKLIVDMRPFAKKYDVTASGTPMMDHASYTELKMKSGTSFDKAYVENMAKDHHDDLQKFLDEESKTADPELKATVAKGEKVVLKHAKMINAIAQKDGIDAPAIPDGAE